LVWRQYGFQGAQRALVVFIVQLVLNGLWTWLFFVWRLGDVATLEIMVLWLLIAVNIRLFWSLNRLAAWLLVPYLAWVSFASFLCLTIWRLNPAVLG
jgi:tryptophan-rich sensory protein